MKKYLLGITALVMAVGLSAFNAPKKKKKDFDLYWFVVKPNYGASSGFANYMVDYLTTSPYMPEGICMVFPWSYKCTIGFEDADVNTATNTLATGVHFPVYVGEKRPTM
jgi:hypothetical protein